MYYYIIAGEASGDLHGSLLMKELKKEDPNARFRFWGGDKMTMEGGEMVRHYKDTAVMGIWEVIKKLGKVKKNLKDCRNDLLKTNPDVLILIDYPGFNLRIAKFAHQNNIPVCYYISPKIWAWKSSRIKQIKAYVDRMFTILPFETAFYQKYDYPVQYVGNPLVDVIEEKKEEAPSPEQFRKTNKLDNRPIIAVLPGSREHEIEKCLPEMLEGLKPFNQYQVIIAGVSTINPKTYQKASSRGASFNIITDQTYDLLFNSYAAVVVSGTAVLEAALAGVPQVALYKVSRFTYMLKFLVKIPWFTLPNIILQRESVKELLQHHLSSDIRKEMDQLLNNPARREQLLNDYKLLHQMLNKKGAANHAAKGIVEFMQTMK